MLGLELELRFADKVVSHPLSTAPSFLEDEFWDGVFSVLDNGLTPKQEAFARAYVETGNASEAYRRAYDAENMKSTTIAVKAHHTLAKDKIRARIGELQGEAFERHEMTIDAMAELLMEDRDFARELEAPAAAVAASNGLAKLYGLGSEKIDLTSSDGSMTPKEPTYKLAE